MNKKIILLAMVVGMFFIPMLSFAETFDFPSPVYVSGTKDGVILFGSEDPKGLNMIDGAVQFHNDVMKLKKGTRLYRNAWRKSERVNKYLLHIQLYKPTLKTQFSFNVKHGNLWGLIPSVNFIPDNKTVVMEYSAPSKEGDGGHHFSLVPHLKDVSCYKAVKFSESTSVIKNSIEERDLAPEIKKPAAAEKIPPKAELAVLPDKLEPVEILDKNSTAKPEINIPETSAKVPGKLSLEDLLKAPEKSVPVAKKALPEGKPIWVKFLLGYWWLHLLLVAAAILLCVRYCWIKRKDRKFEQQGGQPDMTPPKFQSGPSGSEKL